jgi:hypothetical protein
MTISRSAARYRYLSDIMGKSEKLVDDLMGYERAMEEDPAWAVDNLEHDLRTTEWILQKVRASENYSQNLYAALCNNDWCRRDVYNVLAGKLWHCSWRHAGGIIAHMRQEGDYMDWYLSGMGRAFENEAGPPPELVGEGTVTPEILADLQRLGWFPANSA